VPNKKKRELIVEPEDFSVKGMNLEEVLAKDFWEEVQKEIPNAQIDHILLRAGEDSQILIGYETEKGKILRGRFIIASSPSDLAKQIIKILERC